MPKQQRYDVIRYKKLAPLKQERSHCVGNWFRLVTKKWFLKCRIPLFARSLSKCSSSKGHYVMMHGPITMCQRSPYQLYYNSIHRVSNDLENLEMLGNFKASRKSQGIFKKQEKSGKSQGILLCEIHFQPI